MECVTLCWSASEGLSPRLGKEASLLPSNTIHTILTLPATVLSPPVHLHSDTPSPPTTLFHGWICLALRPMHVCCFALKNTSDWVSLFSLPLRVAEAWRRSGEPLLEKPTTPAGEVSVEAGRAQCINTLFSSLNLCGRCWFDLFDFDFFFTRCSFGKLCCTNINTNTCHIGEYCAIDWFGLDLWGVITSII